MTTDAVRSPLGEPSRRVAVDDLAGLHAREIDRLVAYLFSSDRALGMVDAEKIAEQAFLELRATWPGTGGYPSHQVHLFATAYRIGSTWPRRLQADTPDPLKDSAPAYWDRADVTRLTVLQNSLDRLPDVPRRVVLLREMGGFSPAESALIVSVPESAAENARGDALRALVPMIEAGTSAGQARRGPLIPEDFGALSRVLQVSDGRVAAARGRFAAALAAGPGGGPGTSSPGTPAAPPTTQATGRTRAPVPGSAPAPPTVAPPAPPTAAFGVGVLGAPLAAAPAAAPTAVSAPTYQPPAPTYSPPAPTYQPPAPTYQPPAPTYSQPVPTYQPPAPTYSQPVPTYQPPAPTYQSSVPTYTAPASTPLDSVLIGGSASSLVSIGTPIFDSVSAWFSSGGGSAWASLDDAAWQKANRRAAEAPTVEGNTSVGLPRRRPGANTVPSASEASSLSMFGPPSEQLDAGTVRSRLGGFQDSLRNARQWVDEVSEPNIVEDAATFEEDGDLFGVRTEPAPASSGRPQFEAPPTPVPSAPRRSPLPQRTPGAPPETQHEIQHGPDQTESSPTLRSPLPARRQEPVRRQDPAGAPIGLVGGGSADAWDRRAQRTNPEPAPSGSSADLSSASRNGPSHEPRSERPGKSQADGEGTDARSSEARGFGAFYRDHLPQLLALLMVEGARPALAAEIAQEIMSDAYREWARIDRPRDWTRERALMAWADRQDGDGRDGV